jgi:hypothetical protein
MTQVLTELAKKSVLYTSRVFVQLELRNCTKTRDWQKAKSISLDPAKLAWKNAR